MGEVGPKTAKTGVPRALARCMSPESLHSKRSILSKRAMVCRIDVTPARFLLVGVDAFRQSSLSPEPPKTKVWQ